MFRCDLDAVAQTGTDDTYLSADITDDVEEVWNYDRIILGLLNITAIWVNSAMS